LFLPRCYEKPEFQALREGYSVRDIAFYNVGISDLKGFRRVVIPFRRLLRRLLRPIFLRQVELFGQFDTQLENIARRQDLLEEQVKATLAFGWDYVALTRRLAALEDQVSALGVQDASPESDPAPEIPVPHLYPAVHEAGPRASESTQGNEPGEPARARARAC
jgi:hypothetical protein